MLLRCESLEPPMSQLGLGGVKTQASAARVEYLEGLRVVEKVKSCCGRAARRRAGELYFLHFADV